jgi:hypothetical protein
MAGTVALASYEYTIKALRLLLWLCGLQGYRWGFENIRARLAGKSFLGKASLLSWSVGTVTVRTLNALMVPKIVIRQIAAAVMLQFCFHALQCAQQLYNLLPFDRRRNQLRAAMNSATSYRGFIRAADMLDAVEGNKKWRAQDESTYYDHRLLREKISHYKKLLKAGDATRLMYHLRAELKRGYWGVSSTALWRHSHAGTKYAVQDYMQVCVEGLNFIADSANMRMQRDGSFLGNASCSSLFSSYGSNESFASETTHDGDSSPRHTLAANMGER